MINDDDDSVISPAQLSPAQPNPTENVFDPHITKLKPILFWITKLKPILFWWPPAWSRPHHQYLSHPNAAVVAVAVAVA